MEAELVDEAGRGLSHADFEVTFGPSWFPSAPGPLTREDPLPIELTDGSLAYVAGRIDRVEWRHGPDRFRVIDYKTGSARAKSGRLEGGKAMQLPLYLLAAASALDMDPAVGEAQYFYATRKGEYRRATFSGEDLEARRPDLQRVLDEIVGGMRAGDFHAEPSEDCRWCAFDGVCDARRKAIRKRKEDDPLVRRVAERRDEVP